MLHLVFQSPVQCALLERIKAGDDVVFFDNAVMGLLHKSSVAMPLPSDGRFFALSDAIEVRGISATELIAGIEVITYNELVALTVKNPVIQSWS